jgi:hypothetical protein
MFTPRKNKETQEERQAKGLEKRLERPALFAPASQSARSRWGKLMANLKGLESVVSQLREQRTNLANDLGPGNFPAQRRSFSAISDSGVTAKGGRSRAEPCASTMLIASEVRPHFVQKYSRVAGSIE